MSLILALSSVLALAPAAPRLQGAAEEAALRGLDPVELVQGSEIPGNPSLSVERNGFKYLFATESTRTRFQMEPKRYEIQLGGACGSMGPLAGKGSPSRFLVHDGLIYVFASDPCLAKFQKSPARCIDRDDELVEATPDELARGRELLARVLQGLGGADRVDAVESYRIVQKAVSTEGGKEHALRDTWVVRFPGEFRHESAWDDWVWVELVTPEGGLTGRDTLTPLSSEGEKELVRQMGREVLYLARQRKSDGFTFAAGADDVIGELKVQRLVVHLRGATTTLFVDPTTGHVVRVSWKGRLGTGLLGDVVVDLADFREVGGIRLPHAREVLFDGKRLASRSGTLASVEVDPELGDETFRRP